ncbi:MAG: hypothetical protein KBS66_02230 [Eubacterium sp.]|nr:hypothetical protein [Candidatus Colimonas fimequi]
MNYEELLAYLDLEGPEDFQYFEAMADLLESEEYIESEAIYKLFDGADKVLVSQIADEYFDDIMEGLPEDSGEIYSLLSQIKMSLVGMASNIEEVDDLRKFADEIYKFRNWFCEETEVELRPQGGGAPMFQCLRDAITTARMEKLGGDQFGYDFEGALNYELDSYMMSFAEMVAAEDYDGDTGVIEFDPNEDDLYS